ncbi:TlpA family protein disulfide reductase [Consotaella aegiceratis]|uniref:TlpA family protein disulfide reductase n=1 Tax=Consotaella aegiceratis TaxID=3097961 RepID=UPI002F3FA2DB
MASSADKGKWAMNPWRRGIRALPVCLAILGGCNGSSDRSAVGAEVGDKPPSLALEAVQDPADAASAGLDAYDGKVLVLGFWLGGCISCLNEMPELVDLHRSFNQRGLDVLMVNTGGNKQAVTNAIRDYGIDFGMTLDAISLSTKRYEVGVFPTIFVIGRDGVIKARMAGEQRPGVITETAASLL